MLAPLPAGSPSRESGFVLWRFSEVLPTACDGGSRVWNGLGVADENPPCTRAVRRVTPWLALHGPPLSDFANLMGRRAISSVKTGSIVGEVSEWHGVSSLPPEARYLTHRPSATLEPLDLRAIEKPLLPRLGLSSKGSLVRMWQPMQRRRDRTLFPSSN